jgi:nitrogen regulatory protein PII 1
MVIPEDPMEKVIKMILSIAKTGTEGTFGAGKIFVSPVDEVYTISKGTQGL